MYTTHSFTELAYSALSDNYKTIYSAANAGKKGCKIAAVVKADAYGHGVAPCVKTLLSAGCDFFVVATLDEAREVKDALGAANADVLVLQKVPLDRLSEAVSLGLTLTVVSPAHARELSAAAKKEGIFLPVHIKLNTGMNRLGFDARDGARCAEEISSSVGKNLIIKGIFSHLHAATDKARCDAQLKRFFDTCSCLSSLGIDTGVRHLSASEGFLTSEEYIFDMIRAGICLYGYGAPNLTPVKRFAASIESINEVNAGDFIGYGTETVAERNMLVACVSAGYADGLLRSCRGAYVAVETEQGFRPAKIVGNICMDMFMIDVTPEEIGARVIPDGRVLIFGLSEEECDQLFSALPEQKRYAAHLPTLAAHAGTIEYELLVSTRCARGDRLSIDLPTD